LRIRNELEVTTTFKYAKTDLVRQGYDPLATTDIIYFNHPDQESFVRLDKGLYDRIQAGQIRGSERIRTGRNEPAHVQSDHQRSERERAAANAV